MDQNSGQVFVYCQTGKIHYWGGENEYMLEQGECFTYEAQLPHRCENREDQAAQAVLEICPADQNDRFVTRHLN